MEDRLKDFLSQYNCKFSVDRNEETEVVRYYFDYQGGHFVAVIYNKYTLELLFLNVLDVEVQYLNLLRSCCNNFNTSSIYHKFYYSTSEDNKTLSVHMSMLTSTIDETMPHRLEIFFTGRRDFVDAMEKQLRIARDSNVVDLENDFVQRSRENMILREHELAVAQPIIPRGNGNTPLAIDTLLHVTEMLQGVEVTDVTLHCPVRGTVEMPDKAQTFIVELLTQSEKGAPIEDAAAVLFTRIDDKKVPVGTLLVAYDSNDDITSFLRVTISAMPRPAGRVPHVVQAQSKTVLVAHDHSSPEKKLQEFDFMWKEAKLKQRDNDTSMTDEEVLLAHIDDPNLGLMFYWGRRYYAQDRYVEALDLFLTAYQIMTPRYFDLTEDQKDAYYDVCFYIGSCYASLHMYERAYYFLDLLRGSSRINQCTEYVNTLVNAGDVRAFHAINSILDSIHDDYGHDEDVEDDYIEDLDAHVQKFVQFLRRRRADVSITFGDLDYAEKEFTSLLNDPDNSAEAIKQLARIKKLRAAKPQKPAKKRKRKGEKADDDATPEK